MFEKFKPVWIKKGHEGEREILQNIEINTDIPENVEVTIEQEKELDRSVEVFLAELEKDETKVTTYIEGLPLMVFLREKIQKPLSKILDQLEREHIQVEHEHDEIQEADKNNMISPGQLREFDIRDKRHLHRLEYYTEMDQKLSDAYDALQSRG